VDRFVKLLSLRYFHEVARLGSIRRAADLLHVAPSAVSRQIAQLEADLDAVLFFRSKAGVALTNAGETYWRQTRRVMLDLANARQSLDDMRGLRRGEVRIHVIEGLVSDWLPRLVSEFRKLYPGIRFLIRSTSTDQIIAALLEHEADIGLTFNAPPRDEIQNIEEYVEPVSCLVSPDHRFADETQLKISQLIDEPMALAESSFGLRQLIERAFQRYRSEFEPAITTNSLELTKAMAMTGTMIAFMPTLTVQRELDEGLLRPIPVESKELSESRTSLCIHRDRALSFAARELLKVLRAEFRTLNARVPRAVRGAAKRRA
jgi:DNA-binding transcriptional LysR family regulator